LCYGARTADDLLYRREFELWRTRCNIDVRLTVDRATDDWDGRIGLVTALLPAASLDPSRTVAFACGPDAMMRATADELLRRGLSAEAIFVSLERNMKCAVGYCGHCQYGPEFICKDGPIFSYGRVKDLLTIREL
jgi:NAD(P)H-flavin reductase